LPIRYTIRGLPSLPYLALWKHSCVFAPYDFRFFQMELELSFQSLNQKLFHRLPIGVTTTRDKILAAK